MGQLLPGDPAVHKSLATQKDHVFSHTAQHSNEPQHHHYGPLPTDIPTLYKVSESHFLRCSAERARRYFHPLKCEGAWVPSSHNKDINKESERSARAAAAMAAAAA